MKTKRISVTLAAALALGLASCSKNESVTPANGDANKAAGAAVDATTKAAEAAKADAAKAAETAKVEAAKTAEAAKAEATRVADAAKVEAAKAAETAKTAAAQVEAGKTADSAKTQELIDNAKILVAEGNYSGAASLLQQLAGQPLSSDQQKLVDGLKEQIQKALAAKAADSAAGAAGDLLKK